MSPLISLFCIFHLTPHPTPSHLFVEIESTGPPSPIRAEALPPLTHSINELTVLSIPDYGRINMKTCCINDSRKLQRTVRSLSSCSSSLSFFLLSAFLPRTSVLVLGQKSGL